MASTKALFREFGFPGFFVRNRSSFDQRRRHLGARPGITKSFRQARGMHNTVVQKIEVTQETSFLTGRRFPLVHKGTAPATTPVP